MRAPTVTTSLVGAVVASILVFAAPTAGIASARPKVVDGWHIHVPTAVGAGDSASAAQAFVTADGTATFAWSGDSRRSDTQVEQITADGTLRRLPPIRTFSASALSQAASGPLVAIGFNTTRVFPQPVAAEQRHGRWTLTSFGKVGRSPIVQSISPSPEGVSVVVSADSKTLVGSKVALYGKAVGAAPRLVASTNGILVSRNAAWTNAGATAVFATAVQIDDEHPFVTNLNEIGASPRTLPIVSEPEPRPAFTDVAVATDQSRVAVAASDGRVDARGVLMKGTPFAAIGTSNALPAMLPLPGPAARRPADLNVALLPAGGAVVAWIQPRTNGKEPLMGIPHWVSLSDAGAVTGQGTLSSTSRNAGLALHTVAGRVLASWITNFATNRPHVQMALLDGRTAAPLNAPAGRPRIPAMPLGGDVDVATAGNAIAVAVSDSDTGELRLATRMLPTTPAYAPAG